MSSLIPYDYCDPACEPAYQRTPSPRPPPRPNASETFSLSLTFSPSFTPPPINVSTFSLPPNATATELPTFNFSIPPLPTLRARARAAQGALPSIIASYTAVPVDPGGRIPDTCLPPGLPGSGGLPPNITRCCGLPPYSKLLCEQAELEADGRFQNLTTCRSGGLSFAVTDFPVCPRGFHCPLLNVSANKTWPQICPPSVECQLQRLNGVWCEPQGAYEPRLCPPGSFCGNGSFIAPCPEGFWCVKGSVAPRACGALVNCPPGTRVGRSYGGLLGALLTDAVLALLFVLFYFVVEPNRKRAGVALRRQKLLTAAATEAAGRGPAAFSPPLGVEAVSNPLRFAEAFSGGAVDPAAFPGFPHQVDWAERGAPPGALPPLPSPPPPPPRGVIASLRSSLEAALLSAAPLPPGVHFDAATGRVMTASRRSSFGASLGASDGSRSPTSQAPHAAEDTGESDGPVREAARNILSEGFRRCNAGLTLTLEFSRLSLLIPPPVDKLILAGVTGVIRPGRVTAVMGPSGAGKTTFLSVLMGTQVKRTGGTLRINGAPGELSAFGRVLGFVPQEDVMMSELTVRENIGHSARVRLPREHWGGARVERFVDAVVEVLGLQGCADTPTARISGGQRKRANIGMELAMAPAALFLDEPTSGLDATAALTVCNTLRAIADLGITVVAVVHQPRAEIFRSFDDLLLLAPGGKTVYAGPQAGALPFFQGLGVAFSATGNPADELLDVIAGEQPLAVHAGKLAQARRAASAEASARSDEAVRRRSGSFRALGASFAKASAAGKASPSPECSPADSFLSLEELTGGEGERLLRGREVTSFFADFWSLQVAAKAGSEGGADGGGGGGGAGDGLPVGALDAHAARAVLAGRGATFLWQFVLCALRSLLQQYRRYTWLLLELGVSVFAGTMMGVAATAVDELFSGLLRPPMTPLSPAPALTLLPSLGFFICMAAGVAGSPAAVRTFGEERDVFLRESAGHHSAGAYFLGKIFAELPRMTLASLHFAAFFTLAALPTTSFWWMWTIVWGVFFGVYGLSALTSMLVSRANGALLGTIASLIVATMCGYGPSLELGRQWGLIVVQDLAYSRWATELWVHQETLPYREVFLDEVPAAVFGYTLDRPIMDVVVMLALGVLMRVAAFFCLVLVVDSSHGPWAVWAEELVRRAGAALLCPRAPGLLGKQAAASPLAFVPADDAIATGPPSSPTSFPAPIYPKPEGPKPPPKSSPALGLEL